jgi:hypothetical protein
MNYIVIIVVILLLLFVCQRSENFNDCHGCSKCTDKKIIGGMCFDKKEDCEKTCSQFYDKAGIKRKVVHKCKYDQDNTYTCMVPNWLDRYVRKSN